MAARLSDSWKAPLAEAPSLQNETTTSDSPRERDGEGGADRERHAARHDAVGAEVAERQAGDVHRAAAAAAVAGRPAEQLGHHQPRLVALGDGVAMAAVRAHDVVGGPERGDGADGDGLLTQVGVQVAADVADAVLLDGALLEAADGQGRLVHGREHRPVDRQVFPPGATSSGVYLLAFGQNPHYANRFLRVQCGITWQGWYAVW